MDSGHAVTSLSSGFYFRNLCR